MARELLLLGTVLTLRFDRSTSAKTFVAARRHAERVVHEPPEVSPEVLAMARRSWEDRARQEYVGVMVMRHLHGLLVDLNAPMDVQEAVLTMLLDEQRHAALAIDAACCLGSDGEVSFDVEELQLRRRGEPEAELLDLLIGTFVVGEAVAFDLLTHSLKVLPPSSFREVLRTIARDEVFHARFGGSVLGTLRGEHAWLPYPGDAATRELTLAHVERMRSRDVVHASECAAFADSQVRYELESLGVPPPDGFRDVYRASLARIAEEAT